MKKWIVKSRIFGESNNGKEYKFDIGFWYSRNFQFHIDKIDYGGLRNIEITKDTTSYLYRIHFSIILYLGRNKQIEDVILCKDKFGNLYINPVINTTHKHLKKYFKKHIDKTNKEKKNITWSYNLADMVFYLMPITKPSSYEQLKGAEERIVTKYLETI